MSAEAIARVVADLRADRIQEPPQVWRPEYEDGQLQKVARMLVQAAEGPVVDATAIYRSLVDNPHPIYVYEDHPCIAPPWQAATVGYLNEHGNVVVASLAANDIAPEDRSDLWDPQTKVDAKGEVIDPELHRVDWQRVRWVQEVILWVGGRGGSGPVATCGPVHLWRFAIYEDGEPADYRWLQLLPGYDQDKWDMAHLVILGALNFLNCHNVELVEPVRPRAQRRAIERTGVRVSTINVFPTGRAAADRARAGATGVPLTSVRGHFARYGVDGRGLLFGKYAGRFWIPQHARGTAELGTVERQDFTLREGSSGAQAAD